MIFRVGMKVVCVDDKNAPHIGGTWKTHPIEGKIYTVIGTGLIHPHDPEKLPCILLAEIDRRPDAPLWAHRFRPIIERKTDISVFREILRKATKKVGESARAVEQAND